MHIVFLMARIYYSERIQSIISKEKRSTWVKLGGKLVKIFQESLPSGVTQDTLNPLSKDSLQHM